ncbi:DUF2190 family protein [Candidatus Parcubacteria bacterium]|nr:DUF2190 family protein [Candidatus Parcubacteria bacterium]
MSQSNMGEKTKLASEDLSAKQYYFVQMDSSGDMEIGEGATDLLLGVLQDKPESGQAGTYRHEGTTKVVASGAIAIGADVTSDAAGKAVTTTTQGDKVKGIALEAAAADGDIIEIQLVHFTLCPAA